MIVSAPARLMPMSDSIITRGSSSQPRCAAAFSIGALAAHVIRGGRVAEALFHLRQHVEIRERRLHHHDVGALLDVDLDFAKRFLDVARVHLMAAPVAELRRRFSRFTKRAVEPGAELGRVT